MRIQSRLSEDQRPRASLFHFKRLVSGILIGSACLAGAAQAGTNWTTPGGTQEGQRYSELDQINTDNVSGLVEEFSVATGAKGSHMGEPLVVGSTLYVVTPFRTN